MKKITEDQEQLETIVRLDERINLEEDIVDGKRKTIIHKGYRMGYLFGIEKFVKTIERIGERGFTVKTIRSNQPGNLHNLERSNYRCINEWLARYSDRYCYSARVEVFYDVCRELRLITDFPYFFREPDAVASADGRRYIDLFNELIGNIWIRCQSREFRESERLRKGNAEKNRRNVLAMERAMFSNTGRSRWLVLSLTLNYKPAFRSSITPGIVQQHRNRFFAARRTNGLMAGIENYVWTIEQGEEAGLHLHVILFYSGRHNRDEFITRRIGEYWVNVVTQRRGDYWNSNAEHLKKGYEKKRGVGVGQINWDDIEKRDALRMNLVYLAKGSQYLMIKGTDRIRTFGMGTIPKKRKVGRPRRCIVTRRCVLCCGSPVNV